MSLANALNSHTDSLDSQRIAVVDGLSNVNDCLPADHISALVDVGNTIEEALDASESLAHVRLGVVPIVQILRHCLSCLLSNNIFIIIAQPRFL